jgi:hypothetical protein
MESEGNEPRRGKGRNARTAILLESERPIPEHVAKLLRTLRERLAAIEHHVARVLDDRDEARKLSGWEAIKDDPARQTEVIRKLLLLALPADKQGQVTKIFRQIRRDLLQLEERTDGLFDGGLVG